MQQMIEANGQTFLAMLGAVSLVTFCLSVICIPWLVARLPRDYFTLPATTGAPHYLFALDQLLMLVIRNVVGVALFLAGIAMLFLPGQGIITMIIGLCVMNFPYKQHLLHRMTRSAAIQNSLDWLRRKTGRETFSW